MPVDLQIIRACEFVRVGAQGEFDFERTREVLEILAAACRRRGVERALMDVRGATSNLTPKDLAGLVSAFGRAANSKRLRLAIVHTGRQNYRAKLFVFFGAIRGLKARACEDFEEALMWLSAEDGAVTAADAAKAPNHAVPIRSRTPAKSRIVVKDADSGE